MDGRRKRYVPVDVYVAHKPFGTALQERFGLEGIAVWCLLLAAAKRDVIEGQFEYGSEQEAWTKMGVSVLPRFTLKEFLDFCGKWKVTRRTSRTRVQHVVITSFTAWNKEWRSQIEAERLSWKRGTNAATVLQRSANDTPTEVEVEVEVKPLAPLAQVKGINGKRPEQLLWDAVASALGREPDWKPTAGERGRMNRAIKELREVDATPQEVQLRAGKWHQRFPDADLTPQALTNNWTLLGPSVSEREEQRRNQEFLAQMNAAQNGGTQ